MKHMLLFGLLLSLLIMIPGCSDKDKPTGQKDGDHGSEDTQEGNEEVDRFTLSEDLALQMVEGIFETTYKMMSPMVKLQLQNETMLKQSWDTTVKGLGDFIQIHEITEETVDVYQVIHVVLQYESTGVKVSFTYNNKNKLDGLFFQYAAIQTETASNEILEEIDIQIGEGDYPIDGRLTLPKGVERPPVVILVHGSGTSDMDETIGANKPFRDIAHGLATYGIATIRYEETLMKYPELVKTNFTIYDDSLNDAYAAIQYAKDSDKVDSTKIYMIGHSLGGMIAPKIATDHEEVAGIITLAGSPRKLEDIIIDQYKMQLEEMEAATKDQMELVLTQAEQIKNLTEKDTISLLGVPASYWYSLNQIEHAECAKKLEIPMLILQGSADFQVYADKDFTAWKELLKEKENATFQLYNNLNHLFMNSNGKTDASEYAIKGTVDQQVIEDIATWINEN